MNPALDGPQRPAHLVDAANVVHRLGFDLVGQFFDVVAAAERIGHVR